MANRRMISKGILHDDRFTDLPTTAKLLYCYLTLEADDDGFITSKKSALMFAGAKESDLQKLIENNYLIKFPSGVCVIRHWLQMNRVQETRKTVTNYISELSQLKIESDGSYSLCQQNVDKATTQYSISQYQCSLGKDSTGKDKSVQVSKGEGKPGKVDDTEPKNADKNYNRIESYLQDPEYQTALNCYREKICNFRTPREYEQLHDLITTYTLDDVLAGIDFMSTKEGRSVNYLAKVLETNYFD